MYTNHSSDLPSENSVPAPVGRAERISSLDEIRGFAVLGILVMNIAHMGLPAPAALNPSTYGGNEGWDLLTWFGEQIFFGGAMRALFSMLFGAGLVLFLDRLEQRGVGANAVGLVSRRMLLLIGLGVLDVVVFLWDGDILWIYGVSAFFLLPFWKSSIRVLLVAAAVVFVWQIFWIGTIEQRFIGWHEEYTIAVAEEATGAELTPEQTASIKRWKNIPFWHADEEQIAESLQKPTQSWRELSGESLQSITGFSIGRFIRLMLLDALLGMFVGMVAYRSGLLSGSWPIRRVVLLSLVSLAIAVPLRFYTASKIVASDYSLLAFFSTLKFYDIGRLLMAFFWIGALLTLRSLPLTRWFCRILAMVGRLALSNYLLQSIMAAVFFVTFGRFGMFSRAELVFVVLGGWFVCVIFSVLWLRRFAMGPVEWLWRTGVYGRTVKL